MTEPVDDASGGFRPIRLTPEPVVERPRQPARLLRFAGADGFELRVPADLVERVACFGRAAAPREWFGLLVGVVGRDARGTYVSLVGVVPDEEAATTHTSVRTSAASEAKTRAIARTLFPEATIVGPVHTHPRLSAFYSGVDRANQRTWTKPYAIGIVLDPWGDPMLRAYRGPDCEELRPVEPRRDRERTERRAPPSAQPVLAHCRLGAVDRLALILPVVAVCAGLFVGIEALGSSRPSSAAHATQLRAAASEPRRTPRVDAPAVALPIEPEALVCQGPPAEADVTAALPAEKPAVP